MTCSASESDPACMPCGYSRSRWQSPISCTTSSTSLTHFVCVLAWVQSLAMAEPLVDIVDPQQIATSMHQILAVDIRTMRKDDATFKVPFSLTAARNDYIHAFVAYFDITFGSGHKPVFFSTSPKAKCVVGAVACNFDLRE